MSEYAERKAQELEPYFIRHLSAMTAEGLHSKADIAKELAFRDKRIADLERQLAAYEKAACCPDEQSCKYRSQLANKQSEIDRLKERLEIGFGFDLDGNRVKIEGDHPDGIDCRNETIKLLESQIERLQQALDGNYL